MASAYFVDNGVLHRKDGTLVGRIEEGGICDEFGERFLAVKGNSILNNYGSMIAKVESGKILSPSGGILGKVSEARLSFDNSNNLPDVEIAALWLPFVKGIK